MQPPAAVGVDQVPFDDQVLQHVFGLLLVAQHQPPEAVVDGQRLQERRDDKTKQNKKKMNSCDLMAHQDLGFKGTVHPTLTFDLSAACNQVDGGSGDSLYRVF